MSEFWVLTRTIDSISDPCWDTATTICGSPTQLRAMFDLSRGVPYGWRLYKGKAARRFLKWALKEEVRWAREHEAKRRIGLN